MAGVNKAILVGNLGKDPVLEYVPSGDAVCKFSIATSKKYTDKSGQKQEKTQWHNIVIWRKLAEVAKQYLKKGSSVYLEGEIETRSYEDRDGNKRYITEIICNQMQMLGGRGNNEQGGQQSFGAGAPEPSSNQAPGGNRTEDLI